MSVTSLRAYQNSGSGKPRYGLPDAPLDSCPLVSALGTYEDRDPLTFFVLSEWDDYLLVRADRRTGGRVCRLPLLNAQHSPLPHLLYAHAETRHPPVASSSRMVQVIRRREGERTRSQNML
jgi:hypothetical protein